MTSKRTGIELPVEIWKKARMKCLETDISFTEYVRELVKQDLAKDKERQEKQKGE